MPTSIKLTNNQKRVILGLCLYPMSSDSEVAKKISVKRSTFSTIKKQLLDPVHGLVRPLNLPNVKALGSNVIAVGYVDFKPREFNIFVQKHARELLGRMYFYPNLVRGLFAHNSGISLLISKSFTDVVLAHNREMSFFLANKVISPQDTYLFIGKTSEDGLHLFQDYGRLLATHWEIKIEDDYKTQPVFASNGKNAEKVSSLGWRVFKELIENPGMSTVDLARISGKPRNTIARWVNFFEENHLFQIRYIPDFAKIGFEIQTICSLSIRGYDNEKRTQILDMIKRFFYPTDLFSNKKEIVYFSISRDYYSFREAEGNFFDELRKNGLHVDIIKKKVFSTQNLFNAKNLEESMIPLIDYLQLPGKFDLRPFCDQERVSGENQE
jgi:hypothetical protein